MQRYTSHAEVSHIPGKALSSFHASPDDPDPAQAAQWALSTGHSCEKVLYGG